MHRQTGRTIVNELEAAFDSRHALHPQKTDSESIAIACHQNEIPPFVEAEMHRLHASIFSSMPHFRAHDVFADARGIHTYVARQGDEVISVFLFRIACGKAQVLNEVIRVEREEVERFAEYVFSNFSEVSAISFKAVRTDIRRLNFPFQRFNYSEDIVLPLPDSEQDYLSRLAKSTRRNIKYYSNRLQRNFPSFRIDIVEGKDVPERDLWEIMRLNQARMQNKGKAWGMNEQDVERMIRVVRECGLVAVATIDGRICAGAICVAVENNFFLHVIAHDPAFDDYRIGTLCCYRTICACIARGGEEFHFLWGRYEYKFLLQGVLHDLHRLEVYRSPLHALRNICSASRIAYEGYRRHTKLWLDDARNKDTFAARLAVASLERGKRIEIFLSALKNFKPARPFVRNAEAGRAGTKLKGLAGFTPDAGVTLALHALDPAWWQASIPVLSL